jgi:hypothetical protein
MFDSLSTNLRADRAAAELGTMNDLANGLSKRICVISGI